jgi:hypothetical protein
MLRTHLPPSNPPCNLPKPPGKVARFQQLATVQKSPPETPADRSTCHSPSPGGEGGRVHSTFVPSSTLQATGYRRPAASYRPPATDCFSER